MKVKNISSIPLLLFSFAKPKLSWQLNNALTKYEGKFSNKHFTKKIDHLDLVPQTQFRATTSGDKQV